MGSKESTLQRITASGIVAIIRTNDSSALVEVCRALCDGGVRAIEITLTVPGALDILRAAAEALADREFVLGAGTVREPAAAEQAVVAGAPFIVAPTLNVETVGWCNANSVPVMPGALTPTEIETAWQAGADVVKVFPASIGGPQYFRDLRGPLPEVKLMPTGNVNAEFAPAYIAAGAVAVGVGGVLFGDDLIAAKDFAQITANATQLVAGAASGGSPSSRAVRRSIQRKTPRRHPRGRSRGCGSLATSRKICRRRARQRNGFRRPCCRCAL